MRNFSKTLISMAAVMAVGSAMAAGAMAETLTNINYADDTVTFGGVTPGKSQYTLLVVQGTTAEGATEVTYDANESTIKQIDQNDDGTAFTSAVVGKLAEGSYKVMVGNNDGSVDSGILTVGSDVKPDEIMLGDADENGRLRAKDATYVLRAASGSTADSGVANDPRKVYEATEDFAKDATILIGDVDKNGKLRAKDATYVLRAASGSTADSGVAGKKIKVYPKATTVAE